MASPDSPTSADTFLATRLSLSGFNFSLSPRSKVAATTRAQQENEFASMSSMGESLDELLSDEEPLTPTSGTSKRGAATNEASQHLSEEDRKKCSEVFDIYAEGGEEDPYDEASKAYLSLEQFGRAVAALGLRLSTDDVERAFKLLDSDRRGKITDRKFSAFYEKQLLKHVQESKIRENFNRLVTAAGMLSDTHGEPYIDAVQFRRFLTDFGYKMSDEEADELMRDVAPVQNRIYYRQYRSMLVEHK